MDKKVLEAAKALGLTPRRTITQVKIFSTNWAYGLETSINEWLADQLPDFRLIDIKYTCEGPPSPMHKATHSAMVIYTVLEPLETDDEEAPADE